MLFIVHSVHDVFVDCKVNISWIFKVRWAEGNEQKQVEFDFDAPTTSPTKYAKNWGRRP